jgi:hypothetical protein
MDVKREERLHGETGNFICEVSVEAKAYDLIHGRGDLLSPPSQELLDEIDRQIRSTHEPKNTSRI